MSRWPLRVILIALLAGVAALIWETRRLAELAGDFERRAVSAERRSGQLEAELVAARQPQPAPAADQPATDEPAAGAVELGDYSRLVLELHTTRKQLAAVRALLDERNAELERRAAASKERAAEALKPMPEGVRACLATLHECLRAEG
ncbi:MAG: hypothetical protein KAI24_17560, partial [Planctomycetes bacterium]|nr:hypothetical protein [Planctomycetota bacterium]